MNAMNAPLGASPQTPGVYNMRPVVEVITPKQSRILHVSKPMSEALKRAGKTQRDRNSKSPENTRN
jgi:hypothetical protein